MNSASMTFAVIWPAAGDPPCNGGNCPTVFVDNTSDDTVIVQGYLDAGATATIEDVPAGEGLLRVPDALIIGAYEQLRAAGRV